MSNALTDLANSLAPYLAHTDTAAIHDDVAGEITAITLKAAPAINDVFVIEDASDSEAKKSVTLGAMFKAAGQVSNLDAAVPLITDKFAFEDQSDSDLMKEATIQEIMAAPGWVSGLAAATILITDKVAFEDASDTLAIKEATVQEIFAAPGWVGGLAGATPLAADAIMFEDASASLAIVKTTIGALPIAQAQVAGIVLQPAADAAVAILNTTRGVQLTVTAAPTVVISTSSSYAGQVLNLFALAVAGGGSYTLALDVGTLTLNATSESAVVIRNAGNTAWVCVGLSGATIV